MNCKALLSVVILLICTNIRAAVPLPKPLSWVELRDHKSLERYRQSLLSPEVFPFLKTCYNQTCCEEYDNKRCSLYFDTVLWANETNLTATSTNESTILMQTNKDSLCKDISNILKSKPTTLYQNQTESFKSFVGCVNYCIHNVTDEVLPACSISSWLLKQTFKVNNTVIVQPVKSQNATDLFAKLIATAAPAQLQNVSTSTNISKVSSTSPATDLNVQTTLDSTEIDIAMGEGAQNQPPAPLHNNSQEPAIPPNLETDDSEYHYEPGQTVEANEPNKNPKSEESVVVSASDPFFEETSSNFFAYFLFGMFSCILLYVIYNNKSKILALILEGRRSQGGRNGRRKHTAAYRKLDTNLEEAITSSTTSGRTSQIIY